MVETPCIVWVRNDLRLHDNPALLAASKSGHPVIVCYIWSEEDQEPYPLGGASRAWLHDSLLEFSASLENKVILRRGRYRDVLEDLIRKTSAKTVYWNRRYEPHLLARDKEIQEALTLAGINVVTYAGNLLFEPWEVATQQNRPYQVFTPFYRNIQKMEPDKPVEPVRELKFYQKYLETESVSGLQLLTRNPPLDIWQPGEKGAFKALDKFLHGPIDHYRLGRDYPAQEGTSRLSPHLHFGEISVRTIASRLVGEQSAFFYRELIWREFAHHLLFYFPQTADEPLKKDFMNFPWRLDPEQLTLWQEGKTGYPIVDAGMRELMATGWMHNRVRMIVGSFLVKHLLLSWKQGASWFWEKLFDADLANNTLGWQWVAGSGADAAPYFRIFNPIIQGKKFDPEGAYIRHWVPELKHADNEKVHAGGYTKPIVDLKFGYMRALEAFQEMKNGLV